MSTQLHIYTDGACSGNPGPGGWGVFMVFGEHEKELCGGEPETTNNRMEILAAVMALESLNRPCDLILYTDSKYVLDGITKWMHNWKRNGWRTANKKPVKNAELWTRLDDALQRHNVEWRWVKGHSGNDGNEKADELARRGMTPYQ